MTDAIATAKSATTQAASIAGNIRTSMLDLGVAIDAATTALEAYLPSDVRMRVLKADTSGNVDATAAFQAEFDKGGMVYVPPGAYLIDPRKLLNLRSGLYLVMHANAALVAVPTNLQRSNLLHGDGISDFGVFGGQLAGDRLAHDYSTTGTAEWNHGIRLTKCQRGVIRDVTIARFAGDGLSISGEDLELANVSSINNRRQGLTIAAGARIAVFGGLYANTGALGTNAGTAPRAGIDMEPDAGELSDVVFDGVTAHGNGTTDILAWSRANTGVNIRRVLIKNCKLSGSPNAVEACGLGGTIQILAIRNTIDGHKGAAFKVHTGATMAIGSADPADANAITGMAARSPTAFQLTGTDPRTKWDIQVETGGKAIVGVNNYASPGA